MSHRWKGLGRKVAKFHASTEPASRIVMTVAPPSGDLSEVTYDVIGIGDDSVLGFRLHVFATKVKAPTSSSQSSARCCATEAWTAAFGCVRSGCS